MGSGIDLRGGFGEDGGDGGEAPAAVEVLLDGAGDEEAVDAVDDAVGAGDRVGMDEGGQICAPELAVAAEMELVGGVNGAAAEGGGPGGGGDAGREDVREEKGLEGAEVAGLEEEAAEFWVEISLKSFVFRSENGEIVAADGVFKGGEKKGFFHELGELCVLRVEESDEDGVGVDAAGASGAAAGG